MSGIYLALSQIREHRRPFATVVLLFVSDGNSGQSDTFKGMKELSEQLKVLYHQVTVDFCNTGRRNRGFLNDILPRRLRS